MNLSRQHVWWCLTCSLIPLFSLKIHFWNWTYTLRAFNNKQCRPYNCRSAALRQPESKVHFKLWHIYYLTNRTDIKQRNGTENSSSSVHNDHKDSPDPGTHTHISTELCGIFQKNSTVSTCHKNTQTDPPNLTYHTGGQQTSEPQAVKPQLQRQSQTRQKVFTHTFFLLSCAD